MDQPKFAIVGSGRSGTGYISTLLRACGINCGHEEWWGLGADTRADALHGDASFIATFDSGYSGIRLAQVRDPLHSIPSIAADGFEDVPYTMILLQNVDFTGDVATDAINVWATYTEHAVETSIAWWKLRDVDASVVKRVSNITNLPVKNVTRALSSVGPVNERPKNKGFKWPNNKAKRDAFRLARSLGYTV